MALTVNTILVSSISGVTANTVTKTSVTTQSTVLINPVSGGLNLDRLIIVVENTLTVASTVTLKAGTSFSSIGQGDSGDYVLGTVGSATASICIAGPHLESARYLTNSGQLLIAIPSAATVNIYALQMV